MFFGQLFELLRFNVNFGSTVLRYEVYQLYDKLGFYFSSKFVYKLSVKQIMKNLSCFF